MAWKKAPKLNTIYPGQHVEIAQRCRILHGTARLAQGYSDASNVKLRSGDHIVKPTIQKSPIHMPVHKDAHFAHQCTPASQQ